MDMKNWNVDKTQIAAQQEALKKSMNFAYVGHGPCALCAVRLLHASGCQGRGDLPLRKPAPRRAQL